MKKPSKHWLFAMPVFLLSLSLAFGIWQWRQAQALSATVQAMREKAYFSALDGLMSLETDLSKVLVTSSTGQHALLLGRISSTATSISENLAALPGAYGADADGLKYLTQTADYAQALATATAVEKPLREEDRVQLDTLSQKAQELRTHLESGANFAYDQNLSTVQTSGIEYPTLLYDGPFSDGIRRGPPKGIAGAAIDASEAPIIAAAFVGTERVLNATRTYDTQGPVPTWGVSLQLSDLAITAEITQTGGKILWMTPDTAGFNIQLDVEECILHAKAFLTSRGFGAMESNYYQLYDGLLVVSFAAVQEQVTLYPDLVKVQVRMDTGAVVGLEANNYWLNHTKREGLVPKLTEADARLEAPPQLAVTQARLCVIPVTDGLASGRVERLCWELSGTWSGDRYLIYIDALDGTETEVLKVLQSGGGELTL